MRVSTPLGSLLLLYIVHLLPVNSLPSTTPASSPSFTLSPLNAYVRSLSSSQSSLYPSSPPLPHLRSLPFSPRPLPHSNTPPALSHLHRPPPRRLQPRPCRRRETLSRRPRLVGMVHAQAGERAVLSLFGSGLVSECVGAFRG